MKDSYLSLTQANGQGDPFDQHVFACVLAKGLSQTEQSLCDTVGLNRGQLTDLVDDLFPHARWVLDLAGHPTMDDALEEPDLRDLLLDNATFSPPPSRAQWLAAMIARRTLAPEHLWQGLGLSSRQDLGQLLHRHFRPLAVRNVRDMKWKKFFYRQMCEAEGVLICKSPICDGCSDFSACFGPEE